MTAERALTAAAIVGAIAGDLGRDRLASSRSGPTRPSSSTPASGSPPGCGRHTLDGVRRGAVTPDPFDDVSALTLACAAARPGAKRAPTDSEAGKLVVTVEA